MMKEQIKRRLFETYSKDKVARLMKRYESDPISDLLFA